MKHIARHPAQKRARALACLSILALAACGDPKPEVKTFCPQVAVLQQTSSLTQFLPGRQDVAAEITAARITGVAGACTFKPAKKLLRVTFQAGFSATNGPANTAKSLDLPYFVSVSDGDTIVQKDAYTIKIAFDGNVSSASATSRTITVELPNARESGQIDILVGFQLDQDQLAYAGAHPN